MISRACGNPYFYSFVVNNGIMGKCLSEAKTYIFVSSPQITAGQKVDYNSHCERI